LALENSEQINKNVTGKSITKSKRKNKSIRLSRSFLLKFVYILVASMTVMFLVHAFVIPPYDPERLVPIEASFLYDREGVQVTSFSGEQNRKVIDLEDIPLHAQNAFIAIEDERFYRHPGIDLLGIARAGWINVQERRIAQGGSTITQQLVRNAFLTPERTTWRKVVEMYMALVMERRLSKDDILAHYLNRIYFGNGAYGIEAAARTYFDKPASELSLAEAAELAGIPSSPNYNNPWNDAEKSISGRNYVLERMEMSDFIDYEEASKAKEEELSYAESVRAYEYPYFVDHVLHHELKDILVSMPAYGSEKVAYDAIYTHGLRVHTTMNTDLQAHVEELLNRDELYPNTIHINMEKLLLALRENNNQFPSDYPAAYIDNEQGVPQPQAALVLADPENGEILAMGGGRDYSRARNEVLRFRNLRQPGSAIKPIINYAPAFEEKILSPGSLLEDTPYVSPEGNYQPRNWDNRFWGSITAREALVHSRNIPAVKTLEMVSPAKGVEYATKMGISSIVEEEQNNLSLALGGFTSGVTPLEMAQAYGVLANQGVKVPFHTVTRIKDREDNLIWENNLPQERVLSEETAYMVSHILEESHRNFLGSRLYIDRPVAIKTGTTDGRRDAYLASYTPNLVSMFWMGYDIQKMGHIPQGHHYTGSFSRLALEKAFAGLPIKNFQLPPGLEKIGICSISGLRATEACRQAGTSISDFFFSSQVPYAQCYTHYGYLGEEEDVLEEGEDEEFADDEEEDKEDEDENGDAVDEEDSVEENGDEEQGDKEEKENDREKERGNQEDEKEEEEGEEENGSNEGDESGNNQENSGSDSHEDSGEG